MSIDPLLEGIRNPWGSYRFYAPGQHPAMARWRAQLAKLEALLLQYPSAEAIAAREYVLDTLAMFEEGESEAKQVYLRWQLGREGREPS